MHDELWSAPVGVDTWSRVARLPMVLNTESLAAHAGVVWVTGRTPHTADLSGTLVRVRDGTVTTSALPACGGLIYPIGAASASIVWAVCSGQPATIMQARQYLLSVDGGQTWRHTSPASYSADIRNGHAFAVAPAPGSTTTALVTLDRIGIALTTDSGAHETIPVVDPDGPQMFAAFLTETFAVGFHGPDLLTSTDVGRTWTVQRVPEPEPTTPAGYKSTACAPASLTLETGTVAVGGQSGRPPSVAFVGIVNDGHVPCLLDPFPAIVLIDDNGGHRIRPQQQSIKGVIQPGVLNAGDSQTVVIHYATTPRAGTCTHVTRSYLLGGSNSAPLRLDDTPVFVCGHGQQDIL